MEGAFSSATKEPAKLIFFLFLPTGERTAVAVLCKDLLRLVCILNIFWSEKFRMQNKRSLPWMPMMASIIRWKWILIVYCRDVRFWSAGLNSHCKLGLARWKCDAVACGCGGIWATLVWKCLQRPNSSHFFWSSLKPLSPTSIPKSSVLETPWEVRSCCYPEVSFGDTITSSIGILGKGWRWKIKAVIMSGDGDTAQRATRSSSWNFFCSGDYAARSGIQRKCNTTKRWPRK